jgi:MFS family permease
LSRFGLYWSSAAASYLGDGVRFAALPLLASSLSSSPADVAWVSGAVGLPWLLFGLVAGVIVDRARRARLMALVQLARAVAGGAVVAAVAGGRLTIPSLVMLVFLLSTCEVLYDVASNAVLPAIVDRRRLQWANGRLIAAEIVALEFAGPALGGMLFAVGAALPFAFDAASFLGSAVLLLVVARGLAARLPESTGAAREQSSIAKELLVGLRWFRGQALIRSLTLVAVAVNLGAGGFYAILVLFAQRELSIGPAGYGFLIAVGAAGSVAAGVVADKVTAGRDRRRLVVLTAPAVCACFAVTAARPNVLVTAAAMVAFGFVVTLANVVAVSLRQLLTPDEMLGRVISVHRFLCWGALPLGAALAGLVGSALGVRTAMATCALATFAVWLVTARPLLRTSAGGFDPQPQLAGTP